MNLKNVIILSGFVIVLMANTQIVLAQEAVVAPAEPAEAASNQQDISQKEADMQWAWGEVTNLDNQAKTVTLKYLDYETDQEKELVLIIDEKTAFENIKDFSELKLKDTLSVDYIIEADNKNIAKNISFEKPDVSSPAPDLVQPTAQSEIPVDLSIAANEGPTPAEPALAAAPEPVPVVQGQAQ